MAQLLNNFAKQFMTEWKWRMVIYSSCNMIQMNQVIFHWQRNFGFSSWACWWMDHLELSAIFPTLSLLYLHLRYLHTSRALSSKSLIVSHHANLSTYADSPSWTQCRWPPERSQFFRTVLRWLGQENRGTLAMFQQIELTLFFSVQMLQCRKNIQEMFLLSRP